MQRHILATHADVAAPDFALFDEPAGDMLCGIDAERKANALRGQNDSGIDADNFAARIDQRSAGIAGIQRRIGLDDVIDEPARIGAERAAQRANDAGSDGALKTVRIANRDRKLPNSNVFRLAHPRRAQLRGVNPDDGEVGVRIISDQVSIGFASIGERYLNSLSAMHHVAVGQNKAVRRDNEARAAALALAIAATDLDIDYLGANLVGCMNDGVGIGIHQRRVRGRVRRANIVVSGRASRRNQVGSNLTRIAWRGWLQTFTGIEFNFTYCHNIQVM